MFKKSWLCGLAVSLFAGCAAEMSTADPMEESSVDQAVTLSHRSNEGANVAVFNNRLFMAYIGTDSNNLVNVASAADGLSFGTATQVRDSLGGTNSNFAPAITAFNGRLYVAWASKTDHALNVISSLDGVTYSTRTKLSFATNTGPALGVANGKLYLAWTGTEPTHPIKVATSTDGVTFPASVTINNENGIFPPSLIGAGNNIYLAFQQPAGQVLILAAPGDLSFSLSAVGPNSATGPGLGADPNIVYLASTSGSAPALTRYQQVSGSLSITLLDSKSIPQSTVRSPAVAAFNFSVFYFWTGTNKDRNINVLRNP